MEWVQPMLNQAYSITPLQPEPNRSSVRHDRDQRGVDHVLPSTTGGQKKKRACFLHSPPFFSAPLCPSVAPLSPSVLALSARLRVSFSLPLDRAALA